MPQYYFVKCHFLVIGSENYCTTGGLHRYGVCRSARRITGSGGQKDKSIAEVYKVGTKGTTD